MIDTDKIIDMINHWLATPANSYFGQSYGSDLKSLLLQELSMVSADKLLDKLRRDIPILSQLSESELSIYTISEGFETVKVYLSVGNIAIYLGQANTGTAEQDFYDTRSK
ncbi:MAG: hypothetical protein Q4P13_05960 [Psychrobacter sp.]|nr:hypothetical protein [Psychrobacter sp.]